MNWLTAEWEDAIKKVGSLGQKALGDWGSGWHAHFGMTSHAVLFYQRHKIRAEVQPVAEKEVVNYVRSLIDYLRPKPNWIWLWSLDDNLQKAERLDKTWENYPAVCFFMHLKRLDQV